MLPDSTHTPVHKVRLVKLAYASQQITASGKVMSSSKGSKRISVFDRLGPGNDDVIFFFF